MSRGRHRIVCRVHGGLLEPMRECVISSDETTPNIQFCRLRDFPSNGHPTRVSEKQNSLDYPHQLSANPTNGAASRRLGVVVFVQNSGAATLYLVLNKKVA